MDQLFDAARGLNALLPERALRVAADILGKEITGTEISRANAVRCVELAGAIHSGYGSHGDQIEARPVVGGQGSSTARFLREEYVRAIETEVQRVRRHYFKRETAPFPDDYSAASEWLETRRKEEAALTTPTLEEAERIDALTDDLKEAAADLEFLTGGSLTVHPAWQKGAARYEDENGRTHFFGYERVSPLYELAELTLAVALATGFLEPDVVRYVLCGEKPRFTRVLGEHRGVVGRVGDARIDRAEVKLTIMSPDLSKSDLQRIRAFVRSAWTPRGDDPPLRFENEDGVLRRLLIELGGVGGRRRRGFWTDLLARWKEEVGDATVAQLKMREQRLQKKLMQIKGETTP